MSRTLADWQRQLKIAARTTLPTELRATAVRLALYAEGVAKAAVVRGGSSGLAVRGGHLRRQIQGVSAEPVKDRDFEVRLRSFAPYSSTHEHGATIRPRRGRYLAIPLAAAKTPAGVARWASPTMVDDLFVLRTPTGRLLLVREKGRQARARVLGPLAPKMYGAAPPKRLGPVQRRGPAKPGRELEALFVLVPSVTVPARPFVRPAIEATRVRMPGEVRAAIERALRRVL